MFLMDEVIKLVFVEVIIETTDYKTSQSQAQNQYWHVSRTLINSCFTAAAVLWKGPMCVDCGEESRGNCLQIGFDDLEQTRASPACCSPMTCSHTAALSKRLPRHCAAGRNHTHRSRLWLNMSCCCKAEGTWVKGSFCFSCVCDHKYVTGRESIKKKKKGQIRSVQSLSKLLIKNVNLPKGQLLNWSFCILPAHLIFTLFLHKWLFNLIRADYDSILCQMMREMFGKLKEERSKG